MKRRYLIRTINNEVGLPQELLGGGAALTEVDNPGWRRCTTQVFIPPEALRPCVPADTPWFRLSPG